MSRYPLVFSTLLFVLFLSACQPIVAPTPIAETMPTPGPEWLAYTWDNSESGPFLMMITETPG